MSALAVKLALSLAVTGLQILGTSTCPTPAEVQAELAKNALPSATAQASAQLAVARLDQDPTDGRLRIRLYDDNGVLQGTRELPPDKDCQLVAAATATLLRSLELELDVEPALPIVVFDAERKREGPAPVQFAELGAAGAGSLTSDGQGGGGALVLGALAIGGSPFRPGLLLQFDAPRELSLGTSGQSRWWRLYLAPGVELRAVDRRSVWLSVHLEVPVGAVVASGTGFTNNEGGGALELGLGLGVRAGLRFLVSRTDPKAGMLLWLGLWGLGFLPHTLSVANETNQAAFQASLPQLEAALGLGLSWSAR